MRQRAPTGSQHYQVTSVYIENNNNTRAVLISRRAHAAELSVHSARARWAAACCCLAGNSRCCVFCLLLVPGRGEWEGPMGTEGGRGSEHLYPLLRSIVHLCLDPPTHRSAPFFVSFISDKSFREKVVLTIVLSFKRI